MNLFAYSKERTLVYCANRKTKAEAKKAIVNSPWLARFTEVKYKGKTYGIKEVYKWKE